MTDIYDILSRLGVVRKYLGRDYLAYSIRITLQNENYFFLVTKCLYPDVASHFNTNWKRVERDIRTAVKAAWKIQPGLSGGTGLPALRTTRPNPLNSSISLLPI